MSRRKQGIPKKSDGGDEEGSNGVRTEQAPGSVSSGGGADEEGDTVDNLDTVETAETEGTEENTVEPEKATDNGDSGAGEMPILRRSLSPPSSPPRMSNDDTKVLKMKSPEELLANPMDILKNSPFLLPAQALALNPQLFAAQLAQLQAAQMMLAKQQAEGREEEGARKRPGDDFAEGFAMAKQPRSSSPQPMDLSGSKSPELKNESQFNPWAQMPAGLLSMMQMMQGRPPISSPSASPSPPSPRQGPSSPWQAQWASKHHDSKPEDVFKCVWCKESYGSLEALTRHMKEAGHHSLPQYPGLGQQRPGPPSSSPMRASAPLHSPPRQRDILREQTPLPRKLVRGQDVWIGRADEQTRDILKCMGCGASFRSLDLLTKHMQETQHYKKVISQDQISSWKYPEAQASPKNHVNSVLTCKVCDKGFSSLKELSDHMVKANHYSGDSKPPPSNLRAGPTAAQAQAARDRKKALPVKKLLELERARQEVLGGSTGFKGAAGRAREGVESGKMLCERCTEHIPLDQFMSHIQQCAGKPRFMSPPLVKQEAPEDKAGDGEKKTDGNSSILGSLELLVKGNFQGSPGRRQEASPSSALPPTTPRTGSSLFPAPVSPAPGSPTSSCSPGPLPASPSSSRPSSSGRPSPSLERRPDSAPEQTNGAVAEPPSSARASPSPGTAHSSLRGSPRSERSEEDTPAAAQRSENPLAALQMLCDTQRKSPRTRQQQPATANPGPVSEPGAMLAFSWACNQAHVSNDSVIKCPFCDTPFISKGAYRHHLSKMHFTKEGGPAPPSGPGAPSPGSLPPPANSPSPSLPDAKEDETLQSKYHKYAQLAKQLSCNQK